MLSRALVYVLYHAHTGGLLQQQRQVGRLGLYQHPLLAALQGLHQPGMLPFSTGVCNAGSLPLHVMFWGVNLTTCLCVTLLALPSPPYLPCCAFVSLL